MPSMNGRLVPPWYPPPFDSSWGGVWPRWPWWPGWPGNVDPVPPWVTPNNGPVATRNPLSPDSFPATPATPTAPVAPTPEPQAAELPAPALQFGAVLAGLRVARAQLESNDPVTAQAAAGQAAFCVGFFAGVLSAKGTAVPAIASILPQTPKLTDALDLLIQVAEGMLSPDKTRRMMLSWSWDAAGAGCVEGGGLGFIGGAELGGGFGALGGAVGGCIAGGVIRGLTAGH